MSHVWDSPGLNRASLLSVGLAWASPHASGRAPNSKRRTSPSGQALFKTLVSHVILVPLAKACHEAKPNSRGGKQTPLPNGRIHKNIVAIFFFIFPPLLGVLLAEVPQLSALSETVPFFLKKTISLKDDAHSQGQQPAVVTGCWGGTKVWSLAHI